MEKGKIGDTLLPDQKVDEMYLVSLGREQCERIHEGALKILETKGCVFEHEEALRYFRKAGAHIDGNVVRIPERLVDWALETVPHSFMLYDQDGNEVSVVGGRTTLFGTGSDCLHILDHRTGERRPPLLDDLVELVTICDRLQHIDFIMSMVIPADVPKDKTDQVQMKTMLEYSRKPIIGVSFSAQGTEKIIRMSEVAAGGVTKLREKPFIIHYVQPVRALYHNQDIVEKLFITARKRLPLLYLVSAIMGISSPITAAGYQVMGGAGQLAALVLTQLVGEGTPFVTRAGRVVEADMKTMLATFANPGNRIFSADMAHYYDLPSFGVAGVTDSKVLDWQAIAEISLTLMADSLVGANLIHDAGYVESGLTYSAEMLVLCDEIISWIKQFRRGAPVNEETMALDLINQIGFSSDFLSTEHTFKHFREQWEPRIFDRNSFDTWDKRGRLDTTTRIKRRLEAILSTPSVKRPCFNTATELSAVLNS